MANYRSGRRSSGSAAASPVPSKSLAVTHLGQIEGYYCGPASGVMIMRYRQAGASALNGAALNQRNMASASHMETDAVGSTPFTSNNFRAGLNRWRGGTFFQTLANPTNAQFKDAFVTDIGAHSMPFGVSTASSPAACTTTSTRTD